MAARQDARALSGLLELVAAGMPAAAGSEEAAEARRLLSKILQLLEVAAPRDDGAPLCSLEEAGAVRRAACARHAPRFSSTLRPHE